MKRLFTCLGIVILGGIVLAVLVALAGGFSTPSSPAPTARPKPSDTQAAPVEYSLERGGSVTVPNGIAYIDGRDLEALSPLTVMNVNVWEGNDPNRGKVVCKMRHGQQVTVVDTFFPSGGASFSREFKISSGGCTGWIWQLFLSAERNAPIGDQIE